MWNSCLKKTRNSFKSYVQKLSAPLSSNSDRQGVFKRGKFVWLYTVCTGCWKAIWLPKKFTLIGTCVFWCKTKIEVYITRIKNFNLKMKISLNKKLSNLYGENFCFTIIDFPHIFSLVNIFLSTFLQPLCLVTKKFFFKITIALLPWRAKCL